MICSSKNWWPSQLSNISNKNSSVFHSIISGYFVNVFRKISLFPFLILHFTVITPPFFPSFASIRPSHFWAFCLFLASYRKLLHLEVLLESWLMCRWVLWESWHQIRPQVLTMSCFKRKRIGSGRWSQSIDVLSPRSRPGLLFQNLW